MSAVAEVIHHHAHGFSCRTARAELFQNMVGSLIRPAIIVADRSGSYDFEVEHLRLDQLAVTVLRYGDPVEVDLRELITPTSDELVLQLAVAGASESDLGTAGSVILSCSNAHLVGNDIPMRVRCGRNCRHFLVRFDRRALEQISGTYGGLLRLPDPRVAVSLASPAGRALRRYVRYLLAELAHAGPLQTSGQFARATQQSLLTLMLDAFASVPGAERSGHALTAPACVRRAEEFIAAHLSEDIGLRDIVASAGVSRRTLYRGFELARGMTPLGFLRELRLEQAHAELLGSDRDRLRVTDVALRWGFPHLSAFASLYRARFGCLPSDTLRREPARRQPPRHSSGTGSGRH